MAQGTGFADHDAHPIPDRHRYIDHFSAAAAATVDPVCFGLT